MVINNYPTCYWYRLWSKWMANIIVITDTQQSIVDKIESSDRSAIILIYYWIILCISDAVVKLTSFTFIAK